MARKISSGWLLAANTGYFGRFVPPARRLTMVSSIPGAMLVLAVRDGLVGALRLQVAVARRDAREGV